MADKRVIILEGEIRSGKTTALLHWASKRSDTAGLLTPVINGKRYFHVLPGGAQFGMEAVEGEKDILEVGRFRFSTAGFERAIHTLQEQLLQPVWKYLIIDEIGPLEMTSYKGF